MNRYRALLHLVSLTLATCAPGAPADTFDEDQAQVLACAKRLEISPKYRSLRNAVYLLNSGGVGDLAIDAHQPVLLRDEPTGERHTVTLIRVPLEGVITLDPTAIDVLTLDRQSLARLLRERRKIGEIKVSMSTRRNETEGVITGESSDLGSVLMIPDIRQSHFVVIAAGVGLINERPRSMLTLARFERRPEPGTQTRTHAQLYFDPGGDFRFNSTTFSGVTKVGEATVVNTRLIGKRLDEKTTTFAAWTEEHEPRAQLIYEIELSEFRAE